MKAKADMHEEFNVSIQWGDSVREFMLTKESEGYKKETVKNYKTTLTRFRDHCIKQGCDAPDKVSKTILRLYLAELQETHSPNYVNGILSRVRSFYDFLCFEEHISENDDPTKRIKFVKTKKRIIVPFNDNEVLEMIQAAGAQKNKFYAERDKLIIMILADCGLRVKELVSLRDMDILTDKIFVNEGKGDKQRMVYLTPQVAKQVIRYKRVRKGYFDAKNIPESQWFFKNFRGEPMRNDGVQKMLKRIGSRCDIRPEVRISPHTFRHWFAQSQLKNGVSIFTLSKLLGHESINTTQVYLESITDDELINSAIKTSPLLNIDFF